jgi:hypothetical protein
MPYVGEPDNDMHVRLGAQPPTYSVGSVPEAFDTHLQWKSLPSPRPLKALVCRIGAVETQLGPSVNGN